MASTARHLKPANAETVEAWRPALIAFYRADAWFQSAENLERGYQLSAQDIQLIEALQKAFQHAPQVELRKAA